MKTEWALFSLVVVIAWHQSGAITKEEWHRKLQQKKQFEAGHPTNSRHIYDTSAAKKHSGKFAPSALRCCKLAERIARKQLSCDLEHYHPLALTGPAKAKADEQRAHPAAANRAVRMLMKKLSPKVETCAESKYSGNFVKCCRYSKQRGAELAACRRHLVKADRRRCRKNVRRNFP